jgi:hypothetical protein
MDLKSRHFKSIDLKSKSKSKSKYPNTTYGFGMNVFYHLGSNIYELTTECVKNVML